MTKGDRDKLRAEIAGRVAQGLIVNPDMITPWDARSHRGQASAHSSLVSAAVCIADMLMDSLGLSEEAETAAIRKMADELRPVP